MSSQTEILSREELRAACALAFSPDGTLVDALHAAIDYAADRAVTVADHAYLSRLSCAIHGAARHGMGGTVRAWAKAHHGARVDVLQVQQSGAAWAPGTRTLDASRASYVTFNGSRRYYAGTRVIAAAADHLIFATPGAVILWTVAP